MRKILIWALLTSATGASAAPQPIPVDIIGKLPVMQYPVVSPDGNYVATTLTADGVPKVIVQKILTPDDRDQGSIAQLSAGDRHISDYAWANNERLIVTIRATSAWNGQLRNVERLVAIDHDAANPIGFRMETNGDGFYRQYAYILNRLENDPDHVLAVLDDEPNDWAEPRVHRVNIYTGERNIAARNTMSFYRWIADSNGDVRVGIRHQATRRRGGTGVEVYYRETPSDKWEVLSDTDYFDENRLVPSHFHPDDPGVLLVTSDAMRDAEQDDSALFEFELSSRRVVEQYRDEDRDAVVNLATKSIPGELEVDLVSLSDDKRVAFFRAYADNYAPEYWLLDLRYRKLDFIASEYPGLEEYTLSRTERTSYVARDGRQIPALLTLPAGYDPKDLPAIVMPHGGPWAHDEWGFDNYVQFFASRGFAVLQPQFRGSTGFGLEHETAGYGEWGKAIQDDITDGTRWLIESEVADPERICIYGESFGGYAAAMALAKEPELYRCGIAVNGVLDLKTYIDSGRFMLFEDVNRQMWNRRAEADDYSPYKLLENISAPLLIIGSERDTVVPVKHSRRMHKRMKRKNKVVDYVELPDGEHWHTNEANELIKFRAVEKFLAQHSGVENTDGS